MSNQLLSNLGAEGQNKLYYFSSVEDRITLTEIPTFILNNFAILHKS